jgi:hypothetical protein
VRVRGHVHCVLCVLAARYKASGREVLGSYSVGGEGGCARCTVIVQYFFDRRRPSSLDSFVNARAWDVQYRGE